MVISCSLYNSFSKEGLEQGPSQSVNGLTSWRLLGHFTRSSLYEALLLPLLLVGQTLAILDLHRVRRGARCARADVIVVVVL